MRVRILTQIRGGLGAFEAGDTPELPDEVAQAWVEAGAAEHLDAPETATVLPAQTAVKPVPKPRGAAKPKATAETSTEPPAPPAGGESGQTPPDA